MGVDWLRSFTRDVHSLPPVVAAAAADVRNTHTQAHRCTHQLREFG